MLSDTKNKLVKITQLASKMNGVSTPNLSDCVKSFMIRKVLTIIHDS